MKKSLKKLFASLLAMALVVTGLFVAPVTADAAEDEFLVFVALGADAAESGDWGYQYFGPDATNNMGDVQAVTQTVKNGETATVSVTLPTEALYTWFVSPAIYTNGVSVGANSTFETTVKIDGKDVTDTVDFAAGDAFWLEEWSAYSLFKSFYNGTPWFEWEDEYKNWPKNRDIDLNDYQNEILYIQFLQFIFYKQLDEIQMYAHARNLKIMGDMPFYVDLDSADVWCNREAFLLDEEGKPEFIAGCPPDYFSETGQRWGMPIYDFDAQEENGYLFWCNRMSWMNRCYDMVRIDHFRAFDTYWKIPASCPTAIEGKWILGPAHKLMDAILKACPDIVLVAEDLGLIRPEVIELEDDYGIPGMDVLLFRMETKQLKKKAKKNSVLYTGTHDNATCNEDYHTYDSNKRISLRRFFKNQGYSSRSFNEMLCQYALDTDADTVILPIWDICGFKEEARINTPGTVSNKNWTWKLKDFKTFPDKLMSTKEWIKKSNR